MRAGIVVVVAGLAACGGAQEPRPRAFDPATIVRATGDPAAILRMLTGPVTNGGLWFDDPVCAAQFATPGEVQPEQLAAFARCLAGLHLQASARKDALPGVLVLSYAPGFEVEARILDDEAGPQLTWIGYASRSKTDPFFPTITVAALEACRVAGDRSAAIDAAIGPSWAWLKVCLDAEGAVAIQPRDASSGAALRAFADAAGTWKFRPFVVHDRAVPVCAMVRLAYPPEHPDVVETLPIPLAPPRPEDGPTMLPPTVLERQRVAGTPMLIPDDDTKTAIQASGRERIVGTFKMCIDVTGHVDTIKPLQLTGFAAYDRTIINGIRQWVYRPYLVAGQPTPVCTAVTFIYSQH